VSCHITKSYEGCGKIVYKPCSSCISSVQEINKDSIEFSLSIQIRSGTKLSQLSLYMDHRKRELAILLLSGLYLSYLVTSQSYYPKY